MIEIKNEPVETRIKNFIRDKYEGNYSEEEINQMNIGVRLSLVMMRDKNKWEEFKLGLRKSGYII